MKLIKMNKLLTSLHWFHLYLSPHELDLLLDFDRVDVGNEVVFHLQNYMSEEQSNHLILVPVGSLRLFVESHFEKNQKRRILNIICFKVNDLKEMGQVNFETLPESSHCDDLPGFYACILRVANNNVTIQSSTHCSAPSAWPFRGNILSFSQFRRKLAIFRTENIYQIDRPFIK